MNSITTVVSVGQAFDAVYVRASSIDYNRAWENGTGYLDNAVAGKHAPNLLPGDIVSSITPTGRKILFLNTTIGNIILFKRYTNKEDVIAWHASAAMRKFIGNKAENAISLEAFQYIFADGKLPNVNDHFMGAETNARNELIASYNRHMREYDSVGE